MKLTHYLILAAAALSLGSCNSDSEPGQSQYVDIVTLDSSSEAGSVLTYRVLDDSPLVTLTSTQAFSKDQIGKRIFIMYSTVNNVEHGVSSAVNILYAGSTLGGGAAPLPAVVDTLDNWYSEEIQFMQAYRSGKYLNLGMTLPTTTSPEKFECYLDVTTENNEYPELHLVYKAKSGFDVQSMNFFGSYDISKIWDRSTTKGIKLIFNGTDQKSVTIEKNTPTIKPVE